MTSITAFANPTVIATEWGRVNANTGHPLHDDAAADALTIGPGIRVVGVPQLGEDPGGDVLVADTSARSWSSARRSRSSSLASMGSRTTRPR